MDWQNLILCDGIRSIARSRLVPGVWGTVSAKTMAQVEEYLRLLLEL